MEQFWESVVGTTIRQGDYLPACLVPVFPADFAQQDNAPVTVTTREYDLIVVTQSCDLEHGKATFVALCPIWSVIEFEKAQDDHPRSKWRYHWNNVRKGRMPSLHLLASPSKPADTDQALVVDFREIHSLPLSYLSRRARDVGKRWRLRSPFLEHFSQAFARCFMRVGLPSSIPEFR